MSDEQSVALTWTVKTRHRLTFTAERWAQFVSDDLDMNDVYGLPTGLDSDSLDVVAEHIDGMKGWETEDILSELASDHTWVGLEEVQLDDLKTVLSSGASVVRVPLNRGEQ